MSFMLDLRKRTVYCMYLSQLSLKPSEGYLYKKMPDIFVKIGHGMTDMVIDCTKFKSQHAQYLNLNLFMFSIYKNTLTGKAVLGVSHHDTRLLFSEFKNETSTYQV